MKTAIGWFGILVRFAFILHAVEFSGKVYSVLIAFGEIEAFRGDGVFQIVIGLIVQMALYFAAWPPKTRE